MVEALRLELLGGLRIAHAGVPLRGFISSKAPALLCYLVVTGRSHFRASLAALLWSDFSETSARKNLRDVLSNLHKLVPDYLSITRDTVAFNRAAPYWLDVEAVQAIRQPLDVVLTEPGVEQLRAAVDLYRGDFLEGFYVRDAPAFEEWAAAQREEVRQLAGQALHLLIGTAMARGAYAEGIADARRLLELDPLAEEAHRQLMRLLALSGQRNAALVHYDAVSRLLDAELAVEPAAETIALGEQIKRGAITPAVAPANALSGAFVRRHDWGEIPDLGRFYGRSTELASLKRWLVDEGCRVVAVLGMGGLGKTALTAKLATELAPSFARVIWRSVINAPPLGDILRGWLPLLSGQQLSRLPTSLDEQLDLLVGYLREQRCLLVLDNVESILETGESVGRYRPGYEAYGHLVTRLGQSQHRSCLLLTSRERPLELARLQITTSHVRVLDLAGLPSAAGQAILQERGIHGSVAQQEALLAHYSGNPLALKLVAETIRSFFGGDTAAFLRDEVPVFDDIRAVLDQQFARMAALERELIVRLAIEREAVPIDVLLADLRWREGKRTVLEALRALERRSLLQAHANGFALHNVVMEYTTDCLIAGVLAELATAELSLVARHGLLNAQAKEYVRHMQSRLIIGPITARLRARSSIEEIDARLRRILALLHAAPLQPSYAAGNILNLIVHLGIDPRGYDFGRLCVWQADLRGAALPEVNFAGADLQRSMFTDSFSTVGAVAWSPDGGCVASGGDDCVIRLWQVVDNQLVGLFPGHTRYITSLAFTPDGHCLASGAEDHTVRLWDVRTGQPRVVLHGHTHTVTSVVWSPDGKMLASGSDDRTVRVWDTQTGHTVRRFDGHHDVVTSVAWSPGGHLLASGSYDKTVRVWQLQAHQDHKILFTHTEPISSVGFSPDGQLLASSSWHQGAQIRRAGAGELLHTLDGHGLGFGCVAFSSDGQRLVTSGDRIVRVWDVRTGQPLRALHGHTQGVVSVAFSPDGQLLVSGSTDRTIRVWAAGTGELMRIFQGYANQIKALVFGEDDRLLVGSCHDYQVDVWSAAPLLRGRPAAGAVVPERGSGLRDNGRAWHTFAGHTHMVSAIAFSPDQQCIASCSWDTTVRVTELATGQVRHILRGHSAVARAVVYSPRGDLLASSSWDQCVCVWDARTGQLVNTLRGHIHRVTALAFSYDGQLLASGSYDETAGVWDVNSGELLHVLRGHVGPVSAVAFSPDRAVLATAGVDQTLRLWDVRTGRALGVLHVGPTTVNTVTFSPDGRMVASGSMDQTIRVWTPDRLQAVHELNGHTASVEVVVFSRDGTVLASGSDDGTVRLWDVRTGICFQTVHAPRPYDGMNITGVTGLTDAQKAALKALGAVEERLATERPDEA